MTEAVCSACGHHIDAAARLCPYCGADPRTGEKPIDTQAVIQEVFRPREISTSESVIEYARQRQGLVIGVAVVIIFLGLALLHQFVTRRNDATVSAAPAMPLTEVSDLSNQAGTSQTLPLPEMKFQHNGTAQKMRTMIVEAGAIAPPPPAQPQQPQQQQAPPRHPQPQAQAQQQPPAQ
ncbi:MAG TPA: zinc ribbon domain-containing protein [Thermoanaerobaculia bacterium]|nr:zinc ribbon domain-containing protein [Thermoanaerobaculia bacterium]